MNAFAALALIVVGFFAGRVVSVGKYHAGRMADYKSRAWLDQTTWPE